MNPCVILTYNCLALTRDCLKTLLAQDISGGVEVMVVDGGSTDNTPNWLRSQPVRVVSLPKEAGVSRAWNLALNYWFKQGAEYVWCANNDTRFRPDTFRRLVADGGQFVTCVGTSSGALFPGGDPVGSRRPHPDFSAFLIRRECWEQVGEFDEAMVTYCGDGDYHLRMFQKGIDAYCLDLPFYHYASGTLKNVSEEDQARILEQAARDRAAFRAKWGTDMGSPEYNAMFTAVEAS